MPKKFATENPKVTAARDRKETAKKAEQEKKQKAADDAYWADDDKLGNRKMQRKDEEERKRAEALKRKEENRKLAEEEMAAAAAASKKPAPTPANKVTRAHINTRKDIELKVAAEEERQRRLESEKIAVVDHLQENLNAVVLEGESATNVEEAIAVLGGDQDELDKHPEKRMKAAYLAYEEIRLPELKKEHPTFRLSQLKQLLKKEWQKSPENPINAKLLAMASK